MSLGKSSRKFLAKHKTKYLTKYIFGAAIFALCVPSSVFAEKYTLEDCIKLAKENRSSVVRARGDKRNADALVRQRLSQLILPNVSATYRNSKSKATDQKTEDFRTVSFTQDTALLLDINGDTIGVVNPPTNIVQVKEDVTLPDQDRSSSFFDVSANLTLFDGFSNIHNWKSAKARSKAQDHELDLAEQSIVLDVKINFFAYLATIQNLQVQEETVKRSQEQLNLVQSRYDVGSASLSDVLKQKVQFGNDNLSLLEARNAEATTKADLAFVTGIDVTEDMEFDSNYPEVSFDGDLQSALLTGLNNHPGLLSSRKFESAARYDLKSAYGDYLPSVTGFVSRTWSDGSRADFIAESIDFSSTSTTWGVNVSWNIFDKLIRERNVVNNRVSLNNARADRYESNNRVARDIKKDYLDLQTAIEQVSVSEENVKSAQEDMNLAQEKYNLGSASILELLDAQVSLKDAQVTLIRNKFSQNLAVARLQFKMGVSQ
ncbi:MAG: TolC family protein [candidate division Zixibacteria bacterium]|nr:TolC family protein [candidate division Zixibacteria bacterium]